jgi:ADP-ribose pyrophosphatase YjhB (NUDIX family)
VSELLGWRHCPRCGAAVEVRDGRVRCPVDGVVAYANPKPAVCAVIVDDRDRLLLGRRAGEPDRGLWDIPGGFLEEGEHPLDALVREVREETGLELEPGKFVGFWMDRYGPAPDAVSTLNIYWEGTVVGGELGAADDVTELRWFELDALPPPSELAFTTLNFALDSWRELLCPFRLWFGV